MFSLEFMGHVLSARGVGPAEAKVKAVVEARESQAASEGRSFLGLVNFIAHFNPDLATVSGPLRKLIKADKPFVWGTEQQNSFDELKSDLQVQKLKVIWIRKRSLQLLQMLVQLD